MYCTPNRDREIHLPISPSLISSRQQVSERCIASSRVATATVTDIHPEMTLVSVVSRYANTELARRAQSAAITIVASRLIETSERVSEFSQRMTDVVLRRWTCDSVILNGRHRHRCIAG